MLKSLHTVLEQVKETGAAARMMLADSKILEQLEKIGVAPLSRVEELEARLSRLEAELAALRSGKSAPSKDSTAS